MNEQCGDSYLNLYNPATLDAEQLLRGFIDRKGLLERILDIVRQNTPDKPQQHLIVIGPRGMGKTMLLCAIRHRVNGDATLNAEWLPINFYEEQYGIGDLADFWLEAIRHLESALNRPSQAADELLDHPGDDLAERAEARFFELLAESGKRALLLVDNLNDIFAAIHAEEALHQLRALLMEDPRLMLVGTAASYFAEITDVGQPFHDFFRTFSLERLNQEELETVLRALATTNDDPTIPEIMEKAPERVQALRILTGGNPRLAKLGYRILREGLDGDVRRDLERLLDECTPFFKHRIEGLAKEGRRVFDAIARRWDPVTVDDLKKELRKPSNYISAQIKRLVDEGFVEEASGTEKKKRYQVAERFYNIYYLMRYSREGRKKLRWLVVFMKVFYTSRDYQAWAEHLEHELRNPLPHNQEEKVALLYTLMIATDNSSDRAVAFAVCVRHAINENDHSHIDEVIQNHPIDRFGWQYLAAELLWLLDRETRQKLNFNPKDSTWLQQLSHILQERGLLSTAEKRISELGGFKYDTVSHAKATGFLLWRLFGWLDKAETAYRQVLIFEPHNILAWSFLSIFFSDQNRHAEAEEACRKLLEIDPNNIHALRNLGNALVYQQRYAEAESTYLQLTNINNKNTLDWTALGTILIFQRRYQEAEAAFLQAINIDPKDTLSWVALSPILGFQHRYSEAEATFRESIRLHFNSTAQEQDRSRELILAQLITLASLEKLRDKILEVLLALDKDSQQPLFEPLILALRALQDRAVLYQIAREKRDLVLDVMARISGTTDTPAS